MKSSRSRKKNAVATRSHDKEDAAGRAEDLMVAALELFAKRDFASVTIKEIAKRAGANSALIYYYFDNKEHLFRESLKFAITKALANYEDLVAKHSDPANLIAGWFETNVQLATSIQQLIKIMLDYSSSDSQKPIVNAAIKQFYEIECGILAAGIRQGIKLRIFRKTDPDKAAEVLSTYLDGIMVRSLIHKDIDINAAINRFKRLFWDYLKPVTK